MLPRSFKELLKFLFFTSGVVLIGVVGFQFFNTATYSSRRTEAELLLRTISLPPRIPRHAPSRSVFLIPVALFVIRFTSIVVGIEAGIALRTADTAAADLFTTIRNKTIFVVVIRFTWKDICFCFSITVASCPDPSSRYLNDRQLKKRHCSRQLTNWMQCLFRATSWDWFSPTRIQYSSLVHSSFVYQLLCLVFFMWKTKERTW